MLIPDEGSRGHDIRHLVGSVVGPVVLTIVFLAIVSFGGEQSFAPGQGGGAARRVMFSFVLYAVALLCFVIWGTSRCRSTGAKLVFASVSGCVSLFMMFMAFFSRMAP